MVKSIFLLVTLVGTGLWIYSAQNTNISSGFKYSIENIPNISVDGVDLKLDTWRIEKLIKQLGFGDELTLDDLVESEISNFTFDNLDKLKHKKWELED